LARLTAARGSYFWLGPKVTKGQGLELLSDKFVKALKAAAQAPMKNRGACAALDSSKLNVIAQALTFSPSIISYANSEVQIAWCKDRPALKVF